MTVLRDITAERALLASVLLAPTSLRPLLAEEGLRPEHFSERHLGQAFQSMVRIVDRGDGLDLVTFAAELDGANAVNDPTGFATALVADADFIMSAHYREYARRIIGFHRRRDLKLAARFLSEAADEDDGQKLADAEALLTTPADLEQSTWSPEQRAAMYTDSLDAPAEQKWEWPFRRLNFLTGGGVRRKQIVLIGGWTAMGKTVVFDQTLEFLAKQGLKVHSYINEMSERERTERAISRLSKVEFGDIYAGTTTPDQKSEILWAVNNIKVGVTECEGWSAQEIARHIRWNRWDVAGIDVLHEIPHREERDLAEISQVLRAAAKQVGCILITCVHLNDNRITSPQRPLPVLRDVRGSGMLVRGADVVLFIHRDDDKDGVPGMDGLLHAAKIRNGSPAGVRVLFQPEHMRFRPVTMEAFDGGV